MSDGGFISARNTLIRLWTAGWLSEAIRYARLREKKVAIVKGAAFGRARRSH
jgi:hypothetical protein